MTARSHGSHGDPLLAVVEMGQPCRQVARCLERVRAGEEITITRHEKPSCTEWATLFARMTAFRATPIP